MNQRWRLPAVMAGIAVLVLLGWANVRATRADALAASATKAALRIDPDHPQALLLQAMRQFHAGHAVAGATTARHLLAVAPGQGDGFALLALVAVQQGDPDADALVRIGLHRAPRNRELLTHASADAFRAGDLAAGMARLDMLLRVAPTRERSLYSAMIDQAEDPRFAAALLDTLAKSPPWRTSFLRILAEKGSLAAVDRIHAGLGSRGKLSEAQLARWLQRMLDDGAWGAAYAHWIGTFPELPEHLPAVHNGGFEQDPSGLGFDWHQARVSGVFTEFAPTAGAGGQRAAHLRFIGRPADGGDLLQPLLLAPGRYRLQLQARAEYLRSDQGLQWVIRCDHGPTIVRLGPINGSFDWRHMQAEFEVPADACPGQWLELRNPAPQGTARQVSGDLWIDDVAIVAIPNRG